MPRPAAMRSSSSARQSPTDGRRAPRASGAKRAISAFQLASSEAGRHQQARPPCGASLALEHEQQRQHLDRLAQSHVVGQAGAQAELVEEAEPVHARPAGTGAAWRCSAAPGSTRGEALGPAQALERLGEPRPGHDPRPVGIRGRGVVIVRHASPGQHPHAPRRSSAPLAFASRSARCRSSSVLRRRSRSTSTHWPRTRASPSVLARSSRDLVAASAARRRAPRRGGSRAARPARGPTGGFAAHGGRHPRPRRPMAPPGGRHAHDDARRLEPRDVAEDLKRLPRRAAQRVEDLARVDHGPEPGAASRPRAARAGAARAAGPSSPPRRTRAAPGRAGGAGPCRGRRAARCRWRGRRRAPRRPCGSRRG